MEELDSRLILEKIQLMAQMKILDSFVALVSKTAIDLELANKYVWGLIYAVVLQ